jgi:3-carboxy-cis,cis-muconate cycloisomerase
MLRAFGDESLIAAALRFEAALARASAAEGLASPAAAAAVSRACAAFEADISELAQEAAHAGTLAIPLVRRLKALAARESPEAEALVHRGASSQDLADTALMLQARAGAALIRAEGGRLVRAAAGIARPHAATPMLGRTLLQPARPITLGLKAAGWMLGVAGGLRRFAREADQALVLQLGGAAGTMSGLKPGVAERMAQELGLRAAVVPWHARREALAGLAAALAILTGAVGKVARDVALMAEVGEAAEPAAAGRGGSSSMPGKRNPTGCQVALSAAIRAPGLCAGVIAGLPQEHERGLGGWQAEGPAVASLFELTHGALAAMAPVIEGLEIGEPAIARNLAAAGVGDDVGLSVELVRRALASLDDAPLSTP